MSEDLFTKVNGLKICYKLQGKGKPVFLAHGFGTNKEFWIGQIQELAKRYQIIYFDLRGAGKSDRPNPLYTMEMYVEDLRGLIDILNMKKVHLVGHSFGGMISMNFCLKFPDYVDKLILMATLPSWSGDLSGLELWKKNQIELYESMLKKPVETFYDKMKLRLTRKFLNSMRDNPKNILHGIISTEELIEMGKINPMKPADIINMANAMGQHDTLDRLNEIKNDTLIMCGEKDRFTPKSIANQMNDIIPNSKLKMLSGSHWFPLENAPEVNQAVIDFLERSAS